MINDNTRSNRKNEPAHFSEKHVDCPQGVKRVANILGNTIIGPCKKYYK